MRTTVFMAWLAVFAGECLTRGGDDLDGMALVEGGEFQPLFGERDKLLRVAPFRLDRHPVTNAEFLAFVIDHPDWQRSRVKRLFADERYLSHWAGDLELGDKAPSDAPVVWVSWFAARAFLVAQEKRLPTEAEWEFAARADATRIDATGDAAFKEKLLAWYGQPAPVRLPAVGSLVADFRGVAGMHGAVWEWVADFNNRVVSPGARNDGTLDRNLFCAGGAAGATDVSDYAAFMRYAFRSSLKGASTVGSLGFRGACDMVQPNN